jgi:hypothetical protein
VCKHKVGGIETMKKKIALQLSLVVAHTFVPVTIISS